VCLQRAELCWLPQLFRSRGDKWFRRRHHLLPKHHISINTKCIFIKIKLNQKHKKLNIVSLTSKPRVPSFSDSRSKAPRGPSKLLTSLSACSECNKMPLTSPTQLHTIARIFTTLISRFLIFQSIIQSIICNLYFLLILFAFEYNFNLCRFTTSI
jgi:hypothetical protein